MAGRVGAADDQSEALERRIGNAISLGLSANVPHDPEMLEHGTHGWPPAR